MFSASSNIVINGGSFFVNRTSKGMDMLKEWVSAGAIHNSDELYDAPKCHPHTRVAVLDDIMKWINEPESARDGSMLWLFGPAGTGKSAIAKRIAEIVAKRGLPIADFFFSKSSPTRNTTDRLIPTLAYQLTLSIPDTRFYIEDAIEQDPTVFKKDVQTQIDSLLIKPFQSISPTQVFPRQNLLIIIDGLDECDDSRAQVSVLEAISHSFTQHKLPIKFLVASRPEPDLITSFNCNQPLRSIHRRLALDDTYLPDDDIRLFLSDKFEYIRVTHPLRSTIPISWPTQDMLETLIKKSSGQFIYASTVIKFVESRCHRPTGRLNIILGISPPGKSNPFAELDSLYIHLLSSVNDIQLTLRVLSLYVMTPDFAYKLGFSMSPELFLSLEPGDILLALNNLSSILTYDESSGAVKIMHASLFDFLSDKQRSTIFYIDLSSTCTDFVHLILQYVKVPDGIQAGDINLFRGVNDLCPWILKGQLRSDILNFDLDAFINTSIRWRYKESPFLIPGSTIDAFWTWKKFLTDAALEDRDKQEALDRLNKSFESRLQIYQFDWRLRLLVTLAATEVMYYGHHEVPYCRRVDILLEMDDHDLHLADQNALDLRHPYLEPSLRLIDMIASRLDGDMHASAALHCMRFLSHPPNYSEKNECPEMGLIYAEWKATCDMTLEMLWSLLQQANTLPELVQFISNHDIHPAVQKDLSADGLSEVNVHILAFLGRASMGPNWRKIPAIQQSLTITRSQQPSKDVISDQDEEWKTTQRWIPQRVDQCCSNAHYDYI